MIRAVARILFTIGVLLIFEVIMIYGSPQSSKIKADQLLRYICEGLHDDDDLNSDEHKKWHSFCEEWFKTKDSERHEVTQNENMIDERYMKSKFQPRKARGGGGGSRGGSIRIRGGSSGGSRSSRSGTTYRNTHTGIRIHRPNGWQWSRSRLVFLPLATRFGHRSRSSSNRFTTPSTSSVTYYYCTSNSDPSEEIQCSSTDGDSQCCEVESTLQPFCCGGSIPDEYDEDPDRAVQMLARIFYTLAAMALCAHLFVRGFY